MSNNPPTKSPPPKPKQHDASKIPFNPATPHGTGRPATRSITQSLTGKPGATQKQKKYANPPTNWRLSPRNFSPENRVRLVVELLTTAKKTVMEMGGLPQWQKSARTIMFSHYYSALSEVTAALEQFTPEEMDDKKKYDFGDSSKTLRQMAAQVNNLMAPLQDYGSPTEEAVKDSDSRKNRFESIFQKTHITCVPIGHYVNKDMVGRTGSMVFASLDCEERLLLRCVTGDFVRFHEVDRFHGATRDEIEKECRKKHRGLKSLQAGYLAELLDEGECRYLIKDPRSLKGAIQHCDEFGYGGRGTTGNEVTITVRTHKEGKQRLGMKLDMMRKHKNVKAEDQEKIWGPIFARGAAYLKAHLDSLPRKYRSREAMEPHLDEWLYNFAVRHSAIKKGESTPRVRLFSKTREPKMFAQNWRPTKTRVFHQVDNIPCIWDWEDLGTLTDVWPICAINTTKHAPTMSEAFAKGVIDSPFQAAQDTVQRWQFTGEPMITRYYAECVGQIFGDQDIPEMPSRTDIIPFNDDSTCHSQEMQPRWESLRGLLFEYMNGTNLKGRSAITFIALQELNTLLDEEDGERYDHVANLLAGFDAEGKLDPTNRLPHHVQAYKGLVYKDTRGGDGNLVSGAEKKQEAKDKTVKLKLAREKQERDMRAQANKQRKKDAVAAKETSKKAAAAAKEMSKKKSVGRKSVPGRARKTLIDGDDLSDKDEGMSVTQEHISDVEDDQADE